MAGISPAKADRIFKASLFGTLASKLTTRTYFVKVLFKQLGLALPLFLILLTRVPFACLSGFLERQSLL